MPLAMYEWASRVVGALISVRAEEIALRLGQVLRQLRAAIAVKVRQCRRHRGNRNAEVSGSLHRGAPVRLRGFDALREFAIEQKIRQLRLLLVRLHDGVKQRGTDDASAL